MSFHPAHRRPEAGGRRLSSLLSVLALIAAAPAAVAQTGNSPFLLSEPAAVLSAAADGGAGPSVPAHNVLAAVEFDPSISVVAGYARRLELFSQPVALQGSLGFPLFLLKELDHFSVALHGETLLLTGRFRVQVKLGARVKKFHDLAGGTTISPYASVMPGLFGEKWFAGLDLLYRHNLMTYLTFDESYRRFVPEAEDGWAWNHSGFFYFSLAAGYRFDSSVVVASRLSYKVAHTFQTYAPFSIPVAAGLEVSYLF